MKYTLAVAIVVFAALLFAGQAFPAGPKQDVSLTLAWDYPAEGIADVSSWVFYRAFPGTEDETACEGLEGAVWHIEDAVCLPFEKFLELQKEQDSTTYTQEVDFSDFTGGVVYITMTARGNGGLQSDYSNIVSKDLTLPAAPVINTLTLVDNK
jgi:hypothetical protein